VEHRQHDELALTNLTARSEAGWEEAKLFDHRRPAPPRPPTSEGRLRRSRSFDRPTASSARRAEKLFDHKRAVAAVAFGESAAGKRRGRGWQARGGGGVAAFVGASPVVVC